MLQLRMASGLDAKREDAADVRSSSRHVAREKSWAVAFLFPHSLFFCVHGMLANQLSQQLAPTSAQPACDAAPKQLKLAARPARRWGGSHRAERMTYSCFQRKPGPSAWWVGCTRRCGEAYRCSEGRTQPATCRQESRRRQQLLRPKPKSPPHPFEDTAPL